MAEAQIAGALYEATRELLNLLGIHCAGCVDTIKAYLLAETGVREVEGDPGSKKRRVTYNPGLVTSDRIAATLGRVGYSVSATDAAE